MKTGRIIAIYFIISSLFFSFGFSNPNEEIPAAKPKKISDELGSAPQTPGIIARHHWEFIDPLDGLFTTYWERDYSGGFADMNVFAGGYSLTVDYSAATIENPCTVVGKGIKPCWGGTISWDMEGKVDLSAFGVYGWLREPLVEYYIGRDGGDYVGEYDVGDRHYTLYIGFKDRENIVAPEGEGSPFIMLNCDGPRESPIDISKHYAAWESLLTDYPIPEGWTWHSIVLPDYCVVGSEVFGKRAGSSTIKNITVTDNLALHPTDQTVGRSSTGEKGKQAAEDNFNQITRGDVTIQLNAKPVVSIIGKAISNELESHLEKKIDGHKRQKYPDMDFTNEQIRFVANNLVLTKKFKKDVFLKMREINPSIYYMEYTSSTYLKHWAAEEIEGQFMRHIAMCPAGVLNEAITAETTTFTISPYVYKDDASTFGYYDKVHHTLESLQAKNENIKSLNEAIPIFASTTTATISKDANEFVFYIRIADEIMKVEGWNVETGTLNVTRGISGTEAIPHSMGDVVTSPIFNGAGRPLGPMSSLLSSNKMDQDMAKFQADESPSIYYCMDKSERNMPIMERKAQEILSYIRDDGFDGVGMDAMNGRLPMFRMVNAKGLTACPWDFTRNKPYSGYDWNTGHDRMIGVVQEIVHDRLGRWPFIGANGVNLTNFEEGQGDRGYCKRLLIPTELKSRPLDRYLSEKGVSSTGGAFEGQMIMLNTAFKENLNASFGLKAGHYSLTEEDFDGATDYSAAFLYLGYESTIEDRDVRKDGIGPSVNMSVLSPWFDVSVGPTWKHPGSGTDYKIGLPYQMYLPLGKPLKPLTSGRVIEELRYKNTNVFMRKYENGLVIVNPTYEDSKWPYKNIGAIDNNVKADDADPSLEIPRDYKVQLDQPYIDSRTGKTLEGEITIPSRTGLILLIAESN